MGIRVGVDVGGTFTDVVLLGDDGRMVARKVSSTPEDYSRGIAEGVAAALADCGATPGDVASLVHATTVATNTILEQKGARTGLITTRGFRDVLEMRRLRIPVMYDLQYEKPAPLVPRRLRQEVDERLGPDGAVRRELDAASLDAAVEELRREGVEAAAVSLLHAYANPAHERRVADRLREAFPNGLYVTSSSDILPEIREYERTSTAVVNAYIGPVVQRYMETLLDRLRELGVDCPVHIMQSSGGVMSVEAAGRKPACMVESGPAAGVMACARLARGTGLDNLISFDMGGTTAKAAMVEGGQAARTTEFEVGGGINLSSKLIKGGGYPVKLPFIDVSEIGAGGGSICRVDGVGRTRVGPRSAGAVPGPVCYDLGGVDPTLTDALVAIGYLNPDYLVGGSLPLNTAKALAVLEDRVARPLDRPLAEAAHGVLALACATMTRAVKAVTTYRGRDPRDFVLAAFGGNGPVLGVEIARALQIRRVLVPPVPGVFSALGLLYSDPEQEFTRTVMIRAEGADADAVAAAFDGLEAEARAAMVADGFPAEAVTVERLADLRYAGQAYELTVPVAPGTPNLRAMARAFDREHERTYGHPSEGDPVDLVNVKVLARVAVDTPEPNRRLLPAPPATLGAPRDVYFGPADGTRETEIVARTGLNGDWREGPVIVEEYDATCVVPPGCRARLDALGNIDIAVDIRP
ncbi:MAG: hydantoinase/oxoprolinase family protein [Gemmatimonadales bacterium]|nr:hydantoinase/oxoprolinase family protein [Gemmatimonadales bacterium]MYG50176.1 hydantoinase/oxoprolinase family protein [Gemmatimonadales bacterium]MYK02598.1 hydantoinase/oxoprolinase family protein [Candidatus Palauibacter ramosifaciens]